MKHVCGLQGFGNSINDECPACRKRVYVKPVTNNTEMFGWLVMDLTIWESLRDDIKRYGWRVALYNLIYTASDRR